MAKRRLPPDPERQNKNRSDWALEAIAAFQNTTNADDEDAVADLICDLAHMCDRFPEYGTLADAIRRAAMHYDEETSGRGKQFKGVTCD